MYCSKGPWLPWDDEEAVRDDARYDLNFDTTVTVDLSSSEDDLCSPT